MAMQFHATDDLQSGTPDHLPDDRSPGGGHLMPAASLTGDVVARGRKRPGLPAEPSPVQALAPARGPAPVEPQSPRIDAEKRDSPPVEAQVETTVPTVDEMGAGEMSVGENIQAVAAGRTDDGEMVAVARTFRWFKLFRNAVFFIAVFWVGVVIASMTF